MAMPKRPVLSRAFGLGLLLASCSCFEREAAGETLVLGMSAAFTGPSRGLSIELYRGSLAYFNYVNESGGIQGRKIVIKAVDDGYNPIPAIENTVRLIRRDDTFLLFDYMGSPTVARMLPLLKQYGDRSIFLFFPFSGAEPQRQPPYREFVFNLRASYAEETTGLVDHFVRIGRRRIAVFYQCDAYGRSGWNGVRTTLAKSGLRMVAEATYRRGVAYTESFRPQVELLRAAHPDVVISVGTYSACAGLIRDARDAAWDVPIANVSGVDSENLLRLLIETGLARGKDYTKDIINSQVVPSYSDTGLPAVRQYRELMDRYQPMPPDELLDEAYSPPRYSYISLEGYLNARLLVEILRRMGPDLRRERIKESVESITDLDLGIDATVSFGPDKHQALDRVYYTVASKGRFVTLEDWKVWAR
jgi:ABC-type branched-subunit amino acid transport system substrate-binding protein